MQNAIIEWTTKTYDQSVTDCVKRSIENDETVQDVIRKQATTDIWEAISEEVDSAIDNVVDKLIIRRG